MDFKKIYINVKIIDEDQTLILSCSFIGMMLYGRDEISIEDVKVALYSKRVEEKGVRQLDSKFSEWFDS